MQKIAIIGVGDDGVEPLAAAVRERIEQAEIVLGDERILSLLPRAVAGERRALTGDLDQVAATLREVAGRRVVLLMYGDPMFYGLAKYVSDAVGKEGFEVLPHVSSMQLAFARVKEGWEEAYLTSLASHPLEAVVEKIRTADKVGLFTTERIGPDTLAKALLDRHIDYFTAYVCENLGARNERVTRGTLTEIAGQTFDPLNVMVLVREAAAPDRPRQLQGRRVFGNPDHVFLQTKPKHGLLTPAEVRAIALAELDIAPTSIVWDVGAGSGSVSVEAAGLAPSGTIYAIEMDAEDHGLIVENANRFEVSNVVPVLGKAPEVWEGLPDPNCVFMAGTGREVLRLSELAFERLCAGGRLVVNLLGIDHVSQIRTNLRERGVEVNVLMVNVSRGTEQFERLTFDPLKPMFLVSATKK
jgi:precorrin-6Y C5,15-methyltransferase (decarboxylating)